MAIFPERDISRPLNRFPIALVTIIAANIAVFLVELNLGDTFILRYSLKPEEIVHGRQLETLFTSMFMHANILHIAGNMIYLWVFGDELEANYLGPVRFTVFYFVCGLAASALQIAMDPTSAVPNLGASGAIAGVLGAFIFIFPRDTILVGILVPFWLFQARITALILIGIWFVMQLWSAGSITSAAQSSGGGVAYFAHIGGFAAGFLLVRLFGAGLPMPDGARPLVGE
jgi:membrane associated rhomboid family serine protease